MSFPEEWSEIPAVRNSHVYAVDASGYFSRPGPRLISGIEALAKMFYPGVAVSPEAERVFLPIAPLDNSSVPRSARIASA
jgi:iron complex transport system substrate-binding protein